MKALIGRKVGVTRIFMPDGTAKAVTLIEAGPNPVVQIKTAAKEGYNALQVAFGSVRADRVNKPRTGHFKKAGVVPGRRLREIRVDDVEGVSVGQEYKVDIFQVGEVVDVTGVSKGLGFQGTVRRHHFAGGPKTHGQSDRLRAPGSVGASSYPSRTYRGQRMAGRMGGDQVTVRNLRVLLVDPDNNLLGVSGAIPGKANTFVRVRKA